MDINNKEILDNYQQVRYKIGDAGLKYHLKLSLNPEVIAVSKTHPPEVITQLLETGHLAFGENKVQEAQSKWPSLKEKYDNIELHLIGPLQTNKVAAAVELFEVIHTLDRPKLAKALATEFAKQNKDVPCFIQVNTGEEDQKTGVLPEDANDLIWHCTKEHRLPVVGLMCIPPVNEEPAMHFSLLKNIAERNKSYFTKFKDSPQPYQLSMGMSGDFELAACMGATHVRIGSAIFGPRGNYK